MTLDYYRIFYYVARCKSFSKAAEMLHNNQPNITRYMNIMESEFGCKLLIRSHRGIQLTPEGQQLYEHVSVAMEHIAIGENLLNANKSLETGRISIAASETALYLYLLPKLEEFHRNYPHVRLKLSNYASPQAVDALERGLADFAIVTNPIEYSKELHKTTLTTFEEILIGGSQYKNLAASQRHLKDLAHIPLISLAKGTAAYELYSHYYYENNLRFVPDMEATTIDQILPMVKHNLGIGFYPKVLAEEAIRQGELNVIPIFEQVPKRKIYLVEDPGHSGSIAVNKMLTILKNN